MRDICVIGILYQLRSSSVASVQTTRSFNGIFILKQKLQILIHLFGESDEDELDMHFVTCITQSSAIIGKDSVQILNLCKTDVTTWFYVYSVTYVII